LSVGSRGPQVVELVDRLSSVGDFRLDHESDEFNDAVKVAVESFQRSRGLVITGEVDAVTWSRLLEASWKLSQRLLFLHRPNLRGDDVAELQVRLSQMGFNPGRIDGIFGPLTETALREFQDNCGLVANGELTMATFIELIRLSSSGEPRRLVTEARAVAGFDDNRSGPVIIAGRGHLFNSVVGASTDLAPLVIGDVSAEQLAAEANSRDAVLVLAISDSLDSPALHLHYFASYRSHSQKGEKVASALAASLTALENAPRIEVTGMAIPVLRETQMTTVAVEHGSLENQPIEQLAHVFADVISQVIHR